MISEDLVDEEDSLKLMLIRRIHEKKEITAENHEKTKDISPELMSYSILNYR